jgi:hypothetical protein
MVIHIECRSQRYSMGGSDPLPTRFEIRFRSLSFQARVNVYLKRITNRDELHSWRSTGLGPIPTTPATDAPTPAQVDAAGASGQHSRQAQKERCWAVRTAA